MSLKRILKMLTAFFMGQGITIVSQLLIPPFFLHRYAHGLEVYGEWIALSAAITYLNTLNYGIQTYTTNQATICYSRGDKDESQRIQASALLLLIAVIGVFAAAGLSLFRMPLGRWLNLHQVSSHEASLTLYLLLLQILFGMILSMTSNSFMIIGKAHRGSYWEQAQRLASILALATCVWFRASFPVLALTQFLSILVFTVGVVADIARHAPMLLPRFRKASWRTAIAMLKPSGHFGLLSFSSFLVWQGPVLLIQRMLGPASVAVFSLARVVFAMGRQALALISFSVGQEITHLVGQRNWPQLKRLYDLSERVVLVLIPLFSVGVMLLSPLLFTIWLHKRNLYDPTLCFVMALISAVMGIKEHKFQFQSSSNQHERLSKFTLGAYAVMIVAGAGLLRTFGLPGFLFAWLAAEIAQLIYVLRLNVELFEGSESISMTPVIRLACLLAAAFGAAAWPAFHAPHWPLSRVVLVATALTLAITAVSYFVFGLNEVSSVLQTRLKRRLLPST
ncbi:lipopolysaccharide biosynthesis protein [Silvibacterium sp.]|uniref:lipopolysaccharide biosynthesis protein n=1 Tax=Silvibacterium sp. TaxID=1964179 RepID=UPI0039E4D421